MQAKSDVTMVNSVDFAKRLEKILDYYGLSATAFSEKISVNRSTISHLLSARNKPSLEFVMKVLETFPEVELYWLMNGIGSFPAIPNQEMKTVQSEIQEKEHPLDPVPHPATPKQKVTSAIPEISKEDEEIDKIVIFFKDGSFKAYRT